MAEGTVKTSRPLAALALGAGATLAVLGLHLWGVLDDWELDALDLRFQRASTAEPMDDVAVVEIDDASIDSIGRWPWPRALQAGVFELLRDCGARAIVLDIEYPWPQATRARGAAQEAYESPGLEMLGRGAQVVFDDRELAAVLAETPTAFLPTRVLLHEAELHPDQQNLLEMLVEQPDLTIEQARRRLGGADPAALGFRRLQERAIRRRVRAVLAQKGQASFAEVRQAVLPGEAHAGASVQRTMAERAYLYWRAVAALRPLGIDPKTVVGFPALEGRLVPPLVRFARVAEHTGFVTMVPDKDNMIRHVPLLAEANGRAWPHLGLAAAAWDLGRAHDGCAITADAGGVTLTCGDGTRRRIPIDPRGFLLCNWYRRTKDGELRPAAEHVPIGAIARIVQYRQRRQDNERRVRLAQVELVRSLLPEGALSVEELLRRPLFRDYLELEAVHERLVAAEAARQRALLFSPQDVPPEPAELRRREQALEEQIDRRCRQWERALQDADERAFYLGKPTPPGAQEDSSDEARRAWAAYRKAQQEYEVRAARVDRALGRLEAMRREVARANAQLAETIAAERAELRRRVEGRLCFVGSTATSMADFVPTPVGERTPGVYVHTYAYNTIVTGAFVPRAAGWVNVLAIVLAGLAVTALTATRPVLQAGPLTVVLLAGYVAFGVFGVFGGLSVWLVLVAPPAAMLAAFVVVTAYRQLTEERAKRQIRHLFAQAMSDELVDQVVANPSLMRLGGEKRVVSCYFSDLQGFTTTSERLGEERTVALLNHYFDHMTEVIKEHCGGYVNKFLGDGMLVLFGAPVAHVDHAARALHAAVDAQESVALLNRELREERADAPQLRCRVGIATGEVMVGNCGSSTRWDYTAIGDTVNFASRLESANKHFGTRILVAEETWRAAGADGRYLARPLGRIVVVGKQEPMAVWNVLGLAEEASDPQRRACETFAAALALYERRAFAEAAERFEAVLADMPDDTPAEQCRDLCRRLAAEPPGPDWTGAIELTEK